ncbi:Sugar efflux transporter for intercellular exchange [Phytophthora infestans]|uniref:Sugar transporter SWEET1 n=1 Tax=Phytophthora infestans TaxID=4787 RepID=A0A833W3A1_PHYIN|nr:Sugar efflux transporter for intercellular exchange [Phytophthora infestans]
MNTMTGWKTALDVVTALGQVMLNLSLGPDMYTIHRRQSIGEMPALPQVSMLGFGQLAAAVFNLIYFHWSSKQARKDTLKLYVAALVLHCMITIYFVLSLAGATGQSNYDSSNLLGYFGVLINVCMFASPFATLQHVVQTKSAASIPFNLSLMIFASSVLWVATGLLDSDYFITGLNLAGVVLGAIQITLYYIYRPGRGVVQYCANGELPVVVSPTFKSAGIAMTIESPAYKLRKTLKENIAISKHISLALSNQQPVTSSPKCAMCSLISTFTSLFPLTMGFWYTFLGVATAVAQAVLNLSPVPDITRKIGELAALPLLIIAVVVNCHFWLVYAYVTDTAFRDSSLRPARGYRVQHHLLSLERARQMEGVKEAKRVGVRGTLCSLPAPRISPTLYLGYVDIIIDVWMFGSPLGTLNHVMQTKSAASIPINLSLTLFVSTTLWVASGMVDSYYFVAGLNAIGSLLSIIQIVFYMIYRPIEKDEDSVLSEATESIDEVSVVVTPTAKAKTEVASTQSPVYKKMMSPRAC